MEVRDTAAMDQRADERVAYLALVGMALCFGGTWVAGAWATDAAPAFTIAAVRFGVASVLLLAWVRLAGRRLSPISRGDMPLVVGLGATAIAGYNWLFLTGLTLAPASDGAIVVPGLAPIFTTVLALVVLREPIRAWNGAGLLIAVAGLLLVVGPAAGGAERRLEGDLMFVAGAALWGIYSVLARIASRRFDAVSATLYGTLTGTAMLVPLALVEGGFGQLTSAPAQAWLGLAYLALFGTVVAFVLLQVGVARIGAGRASSFALLVPIVGVVSSALILDETLSPLTAAGGTVVLIGLWLVQRHPGVNPRGTPASAPRRDQAG
jgi:drug/metabolite transporter (DMT)-like permease